MAEEFAEALQEHTDHVTAKYFMKGRIQMAKIYLQCDLTEEARKALDEADIVRELNFSEKTHYKGHIMKRRA